MEQKKNAAQIAAHVFNTLPYINQVWVNEITQHHYLHPFSGGVLVERPEQNNEAPVLLPAVLKSKKLKHKKQN